MIPKSVFIHTKRWRDKVNGQSYFASRIEVGTANYLFVPFQYGYESADLDAAVKVLQQAGYEVERNHFNTTKAPFDHYYANEWTTKRETKRIGEDFSG